MHLPIKVKSPKNISKWQMGFNSAFKGLIGTSFLKRSNLTYITDDGAAVLNLREEQMLNIS
jgi:hypothetical protein